MNIEAKELIAEGLDLSAAEKLISYIKNNKLNNEETWQELAKKHFSKIPFATQLFIFKKLFPLWPEKLDSGAAWIPELERTKKSNLSSLMHKHGFKTVNEFHTWSINEFQRFWQSMIEELNIVFQKQPNEICNLDKGVEFPIWLPGAILNITESCFKASPQQTAIIFQNSNNQLEKMTYGELNLLSNQIANSLIKNGFEPTDALAIDMPMNPYAVAIYLGIIKMGGVVVSIADSFSADEIATRLKISNAKGIFTQDFILRDGKKIPLYEKVIAADAPRSIVISCENTHPEIKRSVDIAWENFLVADDKLQLHVTDAMASINILFSSGTTGTPKAIPWNHSTAIKAASDAYCHQDIKSDDILAWPTNLGWMMGPWVIFAALINNATIALYDGAPRNRAFGEFIQEAKVTILGVVPTLVAAWRQSRCMEGLNWNAIKLFTSTGECSNPEDMLYLMSLAQYKPIIEYCGGTEIGGAYLTSTVLEKNNPSTFSTPAMGINISLIDENGNETTQGEVAIIPPSLGLSTTLLNADHHQIYFANMPMVKGKILRRHGDQIKQLENGYYCVLGRADDTMNLGAIKVSSAEIERVLAGIDQIIETAAIAVTANGFGPSQLVIFASTNSELDNETILQNMQKRINQHLNPLFKISKLIFVKELPKTASNKIMRRKLRDVFMSQR